MSNIYQAQQEWCAKLELKGHLIFDLDLVGSEKEDFDGMAIHQS